MSNEVQGKQPGSQQDRISRLTPAQREMLEKRLKGDGPRSGPKSVIKRRPTLDYPITAEQEHLWVMQQIDPNVHYFNHTHAYRLKGELNIAALEKTINEMVRRHENFRTSMPEIDGKPRAVVAPQLRLPIERVEVPELPVEDRYDRLQALVTAYTRRPFDLMNGPLIRAVLFRVAEDDHAVMITLHHIVTDFVSYDLVDREFFTLYDAFSRGVTSPLPELPVQYGDFAWWLDHWMKSEEAARQADYWTNKLADLPRLDLVTDMPRPSNRTFDAVRLVWVLPEPLWSQFKELTFSENVTRFTAVLALFAMLLREYSGKDDIGIATPVSSRKHRETQPLIGYFLNTIVYRLDLSGNPTFRELLQRTRMTTVEAMANSDLPFEYLLNKLQAERDPSRAPLVDASYAFGNDHKKAEAPAGMVMEELNPFYQSGWLDVNLGVNDNNDHCVVVFDYLVDLFLRSTGERMLLHLQRLLEQGTADPDKRLHDFVLLSDPEKQQILTEWNDTAVAYPSTQTILSCFTAQVANAGNSIVLRAPQAELTYSELNKRANRLAHRLIKSGVKSEDAVAILMERSVDMLVATLAVLKAGGAYMPLHPAYPQERIRLLMEGTGAQVLLLDRSTAKHALNHVEVIVVDDDPSLAGENDGDPDITVDPGQLAYVIHTSGSTGTPKGVAVTHRNVISLVFDRCWRERSFERVLFQSSYAFDASTFEIWVPLLRGKQVIIPPPGELDSAAYRRLFQEEKVTSTFLTASLFSALVQESPGCFLGVPEIWTGGDVVSPAAVQRLHEHCPETLVCNGYGPTETTMLATHYVISNPEKLTGSVPIGKAMDNHQAYVLDPVFKPVPVGVPGELFVAGDGIARGYFRRPDLTAERFVPNPFDHSGGRMYRTGDRVRWREDGQIEFLGRTDQQIKLRGYRIELAEIEAALLGCSGVGQAAVILYSESRGEKRLVAYVVPVPGHNLNADELRESLTHELPNYMVPAFIMPMASLPLNTSGKLDRKKLPAPEITRKVSGRKPRTHTEEVLCSLMAQVVGAAQVTPDDNFFALGGDSILAFQLVSRARRAGLILSLRDVFERSTVEALAEVSQAQDATAVVTDIGVGAMQPTPIMCWFLESGGTLKGFSQSIVLQVPANLQHQHLVSALQAILDHHDALRLRFTGAEKRREEWNLEVQAQGSVRAESCLHTVEIQGLDDDGRRQKMAAEAQAAEKRLSAESGLMLQAVWFNAGPSSSGRVLLAIHHMAVDGVSWRILVPDFASAYAAIAAGHPPVLEPSPISFRGWAERLNREALNPERVKELSFWTDTLKDAQDLVPRRQLVSSRDTVASAQQIALTLPSKVTAPLLNRVAGAFHARINDVLLTALVLSILKWRPSSDATSVLIDMEGHGRESIFDGVDLSRTVGFFTSIFPVRLDPGSLDLEDAWTGGEALGRALKVIKEQLRSVPDNGIGYGLLRYLNPETAAVLSRLPKSQIDFNYLGRFPVAEAADWTPAESFSGGLDSEMAFHHPLQVDSMVLERAAGPELTALWTWMPGIFSEQDVRVLADGWFHMLEALVQHSEQPGAGGLSPSDVPLVALSQSQIDRLESQHGELEDILPLTPVQEGMLFFAFYDAGGPDVYNIQIMLRLGGRLDEKALHDAARALLDRHRNLCVAFEHNDLERPVQVIPKKFSLPWNTMDLSALEPQEREKSWAELVQRDRLTRFSPNVAPLFRCLLVRFAPEEHRLLMTTHHILADGWSIPLMIPELQTLYEHHGNAAALPRVAAYRDYLVWLAGRDRRAAETAWKEALAGIEEGTRISPRDSLGDPKIPERIIVELDEEHTRRLIEQARVCSVTVNTVVQAAWAVLLSRHTGREDVVFGSTVNGRSPEIAGVESMIGLLINTVPTRVTLRPADSFSALVSRLNQEQSRLLPHQYLGLVEIQRLTRLHDLFDTLVVFENFPRGEEARAAAVRPSGALQFSLTDLNDAAHYPLTVVVAPGKRMGMYFTYHPDHLDASLVELLARRFMRLLAAFATAPDQPVDSIDLLDARERRQIVVDFNQTRTEYPRTKTMMELFAEQVQRRGQDVAVICNQEKISYAELDRRSNQLGHYLRSLDVGPEKLVGISVERSIDMVLAMLGILKAGGAYVPIDPAYPPDRLRFMAEDSDIGVWLTQKHLAHRIPRLKAQVVCLDRDWEEIAQHSYQRLQPEVLPENLAYVIYTSGSTGQPKAAAVSHRSMIRLLRDTNYIQFQGDEVVAQTVNMSFDPSTFEIWGALLNGCQLAIITNDVLLDVERFAAEIVDKGVQVMFLATALFNEVGRLKPDMFNSVKSLLFGGEAVYPVTAAAVLEHGGPERLVNAYGPAECTTFSGWYVAKEVAKDAISVPIGKPVANTQLYVLDRNMNLEPVGIMGKLYIGGEGLARGYWRRPDLTAERFVPDPYGQPGSRLYISGDLARWMDDGNLEFFGRQDNQIKIRGFRVELGEIEVALLQHGGVRHCAVVMKTLGSGKQLVAYVSGEVKADELKNHLKARLPEYMVPSIFVMLPELPLNTNGKVDRRALPDIEDSVLSDAQEGAPEAMTPVEELLADLWKEVLGVTRVSLRSNFYDLGGHSLFALRVVSRINDYFQTGLSVRVLLEYPVLGEFAQRLRSTSTRPVEEMEKIARIGLMVRRMTPEQRKAALSKQ